MKNEQSLTPITPASVVVGTFPLPAGEDALQATYLNAYSLLMPEKPRFCVSVQAGKAWFVAAPATDFDAFGDGLGTPLVNALPGGSQDAGPGVYLLDLPSGQAALVRLPDGRMKVHVGEPLQISRFLDHELGGDRHRYEPITLSDEPDSPWIALPALENRDAVQFLNKVVQNGIRLCIGALVVWALASLLGAAAISTKNTALDTQQNMLKAAADKLVTQAVSVPSGLHGFDDFYVAVMRISPQAKIRYFSVSDAGESFAVEFPTWTMPDEIAGLGRGIHTELDMAKQVVVATKGGVK
jgi:hypothetical protein